MTRFREVVDDTYNFIVSKGREGGGGGDSKRKAIASCGLCSHKADIPNDGKRPYKVAWIKISTGK